MSILQQSKAKCRLLFHTIKLKSFRSCLTVSNPTQNNTYNGLSFFLFLGTLWHNLRSSWIPVNRENDDKIVGGDKTNTALPYQISLQLFSGGKYHHICGGTIGMADVIITAAHCVVDFPVSQLQVVAGEYDLSDPNDQLSVHAISEK